MDSSSEIRSIRIDKWLWAVRLYKTRSFAAQQCSSGKVKRLGRSLKPSSSIQVGDKLLVPTHDGSYKRQIEVIELHDKRTSAPVAIMAYCDHTPEEIKSEAAIHRKENQLNRTQRKSGDQGRMTKKQRRDWRKGLGSNKNLD